MTSKVTNKASDDEFGEYILDLTGSSLHVPLEVEPENTPKFNKATIKFDFGDSGFGTIRTGLDQIPKPKQSRVNREPEPEEIKHYLIFERNLEYFQYFGAVMGVDMQFDWKPGLMFLVSLFLVLFTVSQLTYTQYLHIKNQNYLRILETLACYGITISMMLKIVVFFKLYKAARALYNATIKMCKANQSGSRAAKIRDRLLFNSRFYKWTAIGVMASISIFLAYPIKAFLVDHELVSLLPIEFMFVDASTVSGFITVNIISSVLGFVANVATAYAVLVIVSIILNYAVFVDMFEADVKSLDKMWSRPSTETSVTYRHSFLRNICRKQQDIDAYMAEVKRVLDDYIFYYFIASYLGQIICLFQIVVSDWKSGYAIAYGMFVEMMFYCLMGTRISSENERITSALQQSNWYSYDIYSQKVFLILSMASTNAKEMWIGPLAPLSVSTGTDVVKSIFTYYNILLEVI